MLMMSADDFLPDDMESLEALLRERDAELAKAHSVNYCKRPG